MSRFSVGDAVVLKVSIFEEGEDLPPGMIAAKGDRVFITRDRSGCGAWDYSVAHKDRGGGFGVTESEIELDTRG